MSLPLPYRHAPESGGVAQVPLMAVLGDTVHDVEVGGGPHGGCSFWKW
ncbi:MAG: hypothetical protein R2694_01910 [Ilumatobacteraceae bacterium]